MNCLVGREIVLGKGGAVLFAHRLTVPCKPLEKRLKIPDLVERLWDRSGISCEVLKGGKVAVGDTVVAGSSHPERIDTIFPPEMFLRPSERQK